MPKKKSCLKLVRKSKKKAAARKKMLKEKGCASSTKPS